MRATPPNVWSDAPPVSLAGAVRLALPQAQRAARPGVMALVLSVALHAAPFALVGLSWGTQPPTSAGEQAIDLEMIIADEDIMPAPPVEAQDLPPTEQPEPPSLAAAQAPEKPREVEPKPEDVAEEHLDKSKPEPALTPAEQRIISVASHAPATAASEATQAALDPRYSARVARHLARFKRFPVGAHASQTLMGRVVIRFSLDGEGRVIDLALVSPSGVPAFDTEALAMVHRATPFPKATGTTVPVQSFTIPVSYRLRD